MPVTGRISELSVDSVAAGVEVAVSDGLLDSQEVTPAAASPKLASSFEAVLQLAAERLDRPVVEVISMGSEVLDLGLHRFLPAFPCAQHLLQRADHSVFLSVA